MGIYYVSREKYNPKRSGMMDRSLMTVTDLWGTLGLSTSSSAQSHAVTARPIATDPELIQKTFL
jgi:hypothetical protein